MPSGVKVLVIVLASIREGFGGIEEGEDHHRVDLIQRLDWILGQLGLGLKHLTLGLRRSYLRYEEAMRGARDIVGDGEA